MNQRFRQLILQTFGAKMKTIITTAILFLLCQNIMAETNFPKFQELISVPCAYEYSFANSETISNADPIFLTIVSKSDVFYSNDGSSFCIVDVQPYVKKTATDLAYFSFSDDKILQINDNTTDQFKFLIYLYNFRETENMTIHVNKMGKAINQLWRGNFKDFNIYIKINNKSKKIEKKWISDNSKSAFAVFFQKNSAKSEINSDLKFSLEINPKVIKKPRISLFCEIEGKKKDAFNEIDEDIKVNILGQGCDETNFMNMKYLDDIKVFNAVLHCPFRTRGYTVNVASEIFAEVNQNIEIQDDKKFAIEMKMNKPVLCAIINPSEQFRKGPVKTKAKNFNHFKRHFYDTINYLDSASPWLNQWASSHFFVKYSGIKMQTLIKTGISTIQWDREAIRNEVLEKIYLKYGRESVPYDQIVNSGIEFIKKFSISDSIPLKGVIFIVAANPPLCVKPELMDILNNLLEKNKMGASIVQFGSDNENFVDHTKDKEKYKKLLFMEFNLENEFNNWYFGPSFKKIRNGFWSFMVQNGFSLRYLNE